MGSRVYHSIFQISEHVPSHSARNLLQGRLRCISRLFFLHSTFHTSARGIGFWVDTVAGIFTVLINSRDVDNSGLGHSVTDFCGWYAIN